MNKENGYLPLSFFWDAFSSLFKENFSLKKTFLVLVLNTKLQLDLSRIIPSPWGTWLTQLVEHVTFDLGDREFKPHVGCGDYLNK